MATNRARRAPGHLTDESKSLWRRIDREYDLEDHHRRVLTLMCESLDLADQAREAIAEHGLTMLDGNGNPKARPEVSIMRDARVTAARMLRELALDDEAVADPRLPRQR